MPNTNGAGVTIIRCVPMVPCLCTRSALQDYVMAPPDTWETIAFFALGIIVVLWFRPGIKAALERSRQARDRDWRAVLIALVAVVLLVLLLIALARSTSSQRGSDPGLSDAVISWYEVTHAAPCFFDTAGPRQCGNCTL